MRRILALAVSAIMSLGCGSPKLDEAERLIAAGEYLRAQGIAELEATSRPKDARAHFVFAKASLLVAEPEVAKAAFERALPLNPKLQAYVGSAYLEAARTLFANEGTRNEHTELIRAYLAAAQKFGFPSAPDTDKWIADTRALLLSPQEKLANALEVAFEADPEIQVANHRRVMAEMRMLSTAFDGYAVDSSDTAYPDASELVRLPQLLSKYLRDFPAADPWGTPYRFEVSPDRLNYRITSAAADRQFEVQQPLLSSSAGAAYYKSAETPVYTDSAARDIIYVNGRLLAQVWRTAM